MTKLYLCDCGNRYRSLHTVDTCIENDHVWSHYQTQLKGESRTVHFASFLTLRRAQQLLERIAKRYPNATPMFEGSYSVSVIERERWKDGPVIYQYQVIPWEQAELPSMAASDLTDREIRSRGSDSIEGDDNV